MATLTNNLNYLQPTSYKLTIDRENYPNLEYFAQSLTHPGMIMNPVELPYRNVTGVPITGSKLTYNELSANLILDENLSSYNEMYSWMRRILTQEELSQRVISKSIFRDFNVFFVLGFFLSPTNSK